MSTVYTQTYSVEREISMPGMEDHDWQEIDLFAEYHVRDGLICDVKLYDSGAGLVELDDAEFDACLQWLHDHHED